MAEDYKVEEYKQNSLLPNISVATVYIPKLQQTVEIPFNSLSTTDEVKSKVLNEVNNVYRLEEEKVNLVGGEEKYRMMFDNYISQQKATSDLSNTPLNLNKIYSDIADPKTPFTFANEYTKDVIDFLEDPEEFKANNPDKFIKLNNKFNRGFTIRLSKPSEDLQKSIDFLVDTAKKNKIFGDASYDEIYNNIRNGVVASEKYIDNVYGMYYDSLIAEKSNLTNRLSDIETPEKEKENYVARINMINKELKNFNISKEKYNKVFDSAWNERYIYNLISKGLSYGAGLVGGAVGTVIEPVGGTAVGFMAGKTLVEVANKIFFSKDVLEMMGRSEQEIKIMQDRFYGGLQSDNTKYKVFDLGLNAVDFMVDLMTLKSAFTPLEISLNKKIGTVLGEAMIKNKSIPKYIDVVSSLIPRTISHGAGMSIASAMMSQTYGLNKGDAIKQVAEDFGRGFLMGAIVGNVNELSNSVISKVFGSAGTNVFSKGMGFLSRGVINTAISSALFRPDVTDKSTFENLLNVDFNSANSTVQFMIDSVFDIFASFDKTTLGDVYDFYKYNRLDNMIDLIKTKSLGDLIDGNLKISRMIEDVGQLNAIKNDLIIKLKKGETQVEGSKKIYGMIKEVDAKLELLKSDLEEVPSGVKTNNDVFKDIVNDFVKDNFDRPINNFEGAIIVNDKFISDTNKKIKEYNEKKKSLSGRRKNISKEAKVNNVEDQKKLLKLKKEKNKLLTQKRRASDKKKPAIEDKIDKINNDILDLTTKIKIDKLEFKEKKLAELEKEQSIYNEEQKKLRDKLKELNQAKKDIQDTIKDLKKKKKKPFEDKKLKNKITNFNNKLKSSLQKEIETFERLRNKLADYVEKNINIDVDEIPVGYDFIKYIFKKYDGIDKRLVLDLFKKYKSGKIKNSEFLNILNTMLYEKGVRDFATNTKKNLDDLSYSESKRFISIMKKLKNSPDKQETLYNFIKKNPDMMKLFLYNGSDFVSEAKLLGKKYKDDEFISYVNTLTDRIMGSEVSDQSMFAMYSNKIKELFKLEKDLDEQEKLGRIDKDKAGALRNNIRNERLYLAERASRHYKSSDGKIKLGSTKNSFATEQEISSFLDKYPMLQPVIDLCRDADDKIDTFIFSSLKGAVSEHLGAIEPLVSNNRIYLTFRLAGLDDITINSILREYLKSDELGNIKSFLETQYDRKGILGLEQIANGLLVKRIAMYSKGKLSSSVVSRLINELSLNYNGKDLVALPELIKSIFGKSIFELKNSDINDFLYNKYRKSFTKKLSKLSDSIEFLMGYTDKDLIKTISDFTGIEIKRVEEILKPLTKYSFDKVVKSNYSDVDFKAKITDIYKEIENLKEGPEDIPKELLNYLNDLGLKAEKESGNTIGLSSKLLPQREVFGKFVNKWTVGKIEIGLSKSQIKEYAGNKKQFARQLLGRIYGAVSNDTRRAGRIIGGEYDIKNFGTLFPTVEETDRYFMSRNEYTGFIIDKSTGDIYKIQNLDLFRDVYERFMFNQGIFRSVLTGVEKKLVDVNKKISQVASRQNKTIGEMNNLIKNILDTNETITNTVEIKGVDGETKTIEIDNEVVAIAKELRKLTTDLYNTGQTFGVVFDYRSAYYPRMSDGEFVAPLFDDLVYLNNDGSVKRISDVKQLENIQDPSFTKQREGELLTGDNVIEDMARHSVGILRASIFRRDLEYLNIKYGKIGIDNVGKKFMENHILKRMGMLTEFDKITMKSISNSLNNLFKTNVSSNDVAGLIDDILTFNYASVLNTPHQFIRNLITQPLTLLIPHTSVGSYIQGLFEVVKMLGNDNLGYTKMKKFMLENNLRHGEIFDSGLEETLDLIRSNFALQTGRTKLRKLSNLALKFFDMSDMINRITSYKTAEIYFDKVIYKSTSLTYLDKKLKLGILNEGRKSQIREFLKNNNFEEAKKTYALAITEDTQYIYGGAETPQILNNRIARLFGQYKSWGLNYTSLISKVLKKIKNGTPEERMGATTFLLKHFLANTAIIYGMVSLGANPIRYMSLSALPVVGDAIVEGIMKTAWNTTNTIYNNTDDETLKKAIEVFGGNNEIASMGIMSPYGGSNFGFMTLPAFKSMGEFITSLGKSSAEYVTEPTTIVEAEKEKQVYRKTVSKGLQALSSYIPFGNAVYRPTRDLVLRQGYKFNSFKENVLTLLGIPHFKEPKQYKTLKIVEDVLKRTNGQRFEIIAESVNKVYTAYTNKLPLRDKTIKKLIIHFKKYYGDKGIPPLSASDTFRYNVWLSNDDMRKKYIWNVYMKYKTGDITEDDYRNELYKIQAVFPNYTNKRINNIIKKQKIDLVKFKLKAGS